MRVLFNGITLLKPKTGIAHAAANLHAGLVAQYPADTFWLYPGPTAAKLASRFFKSKPNPPAVPANTNPSPLKRVKRLARKAAGVVARVGYRTHFQAAARFGAL